ncbi:YesL family protein [Alicyclobacillus sacchari]|uniref:YesL family protein n=1 Tax=Alicyclobacillus sacchari TaxID=392010 RepID=UPI003D6733A0
MHVDIPLLHSQCALYPLLYPDCHHSGGNWGLFATARKYAYDDDVPILSTFWSGFCENWKQSTVVGFLFLFILGIAYGDSRIIAWLRLTSGREAAICLICAVLMSLSILLHAYPLMVHMRLTTRQVLVNAIRLNFVKPHLTVVGLGMVAGMGYLSAAYPVLFLTCTCSVLSSALFRIVDRKLEVVIKLSHGHLPITVLDQSNPSSRPHSVQ